MTTETRASKKTARKTATISTEALRYLANEVAEGLGWSQIDLMEKETREVIVYLHEAFTALEEAEGVA